MLLFLIPLLTYCMLIFCSAYWYIMDIAKLIFGSDNIIYNSKNHQIVLTIDDVPHCDQSFEKILNVLDKYNCKATFFVISSYVNPQNRHLLIDAIKRGHHLGNHGKYNTRHAFLSQKKLIEEISECQKLIVELYNEANIMIPAIKYYRPGYGMINATIRKYCKEENYTIVLGSNYCSDTKCLLCMNEFYIVNHLQSNDIIIVHDKIKTVDLLERLFKKGIRTIHL